MYLVQQADVCPTFEVGKNNALCDDSPILRCESGSVTQLKLSGNVHVCFFEATGVVRCVVDVVLFCVRFVFNSIEDYDQLLFFLLFFCFFSLFFPFLSLTIFESCSKQTQ